MDLALQMNFNEKVLDSFVKILVAEDQDFDGRAGELHKHIFK